MGQLILERTARHVPEPCVPAGAMWPGHGGSPSDEGASAAVQGQSPGDAFGGSGQAGADHPSMGDRLEIRMGRLLAVLATAPFYILFFVLAFALYPLLAVRGAPTGGAGV